MSFVPIIVPATQQPPSAEALELGGRLIEVIRGYQSEHPRANESDIDRALSIARSTLDRSSVRRTTLAVVAGLLVLLLGGIVAYFFASGGLPESEIPWTLVAVGGLVVVAALFAVISRA